MVDFPANPTDGQVHTENGSSWRFSATPAPGLWEKVGSGAFFLQEFHDPTDTASWRIVGSTLEIWGKVVTESNGSSGTITLPKTFQNPPHVTALGEDNNSSTIVHYATVTETTVSFRVRNEAASPVIRGMHWRAIGQWDGSS